MDKKIVLVTGGTSGIGLGVIKDLSATNKWVSISMSRDINRIEQAKDELGCSNSDVKFYNGDICELKDCEEVAAKIKNEYGKLNGLVNCAGTITTGGIEDCALSDWINVINANLNGAFMITQSVLPLLKKANEGSIVNMSSVCSLRPCSSIAYSVSKAGIDMFTKCMAKELSVHGIRVNSINPGVVRSNLQISAGIVDDYEKFIEQMAPLHPLGRIGKPIDIAKMVNFLLSEQSSWITGAVISVDGGRSL